MDIEVFKNKFNHRVNKNIYYYESSNMGLIRLRSKSKFEPCLAIIEDRYNYHVLHKDGRYYERPKREFQIVCASH